MSDALRTRYLSLLQEKFNFIAKHIEAIHIKVDAKNPASIETAAAELKLVINDLEELQSFQRSLPDVEPSVVSGEAMRTIGSEIDDLLEQVKGLLVQLETINLRFKERSALPDARKAPYVPSALTQAEIARLFLLVAKAFSIKYITADQKR